MHWFNILKTSKDFSNLHYSRNITSVMYQSPDSEKLILMNMSRGGLGGDLSQNEIDFQEKLKGERMKLKDEVDLIISHYTKNGGKVYIMSESDGNLYIGENGKLKEITVVARG